MQRRQFLKAAGVTAAAAPVLAHTSTEAVPCHEWEYYGLRGGIVKIINKSRYSLPDFRAWVTYAAPQMHECEVCGEWYSKLAVDKFEVGPFTVPSALAVPEPVAVLPVACAKEPDFRVKARWGPYSPVSLKAKQEEDWLWVAYVT